MPASGSVSGTAISRRFRVGQRCAGRGARSLSTFAVAGPCPLFPHAPVVAAPARVHRLDGRAISRTAQVREPVNFALQLQLGTDHGDSRSTVNSMNVRTLAALSWRDG